MNTGANDHGPTGLARRILLACRDRVLRWRFMYVALNGTLVAGRVPWPEFAHLAAKVGFPGTDVNVIQAMESGVGPTRKLLADLKLQPAVVALPVEFRKGEQTFRQDLVKLAPAAEFAKAIGCLRMNNAEEQQIREGSAKA